MLLANPARCGQGYADKRLQKDAPVKNPLSPQFLGERARVRG